MAFNVGMSSKDAFKQLRQLSPRKRVEAVSGAQGVSILSSLTPTQFAELFPKYYQRSLPDVGGFREAISKMSRQRQDDINFGLANGANSLQEAERMGQSRDSMTSTGGYSSGGSLKAIIDKASAKYGIDPRIMYGIVRGESSHGNSYDKNENLGTSDLSYGPFQMNVLRAGMEGDRFQKATGLSVKDPSSLQAQADWVARRIREMGSDPAKINAVWHGYKGNADWNPTWGTMGAGPATPGTSTASGPDFSQHVMFKGVNNYKGQCGVGARTLAGHMFGNSYFMKNGIGAGGDEHAGSLSAGNNYFQTSGMFRAGKPVSKDGLTQDYLNSLPIGTVVSSQGGSRGGHVQIKIGPNQWASDTLQSGFFYGNSYSNFVVHQPNEAGLAALANNGVVQDGMPGEGKATVTTADAQQEAAQVSAQKTAPAAPPAPTQPELPQEVPDTQTATVNKPKAEAPKDRTFTLNRQELISAIKQTDEFKNTFGSSLATDDMIYNGFFDDARTKQLMKQTGSSYDANTGTVKIGNYDKFQKNIGMDTSKILNEVASNVPSHAGGGREKVKGPIHIHRLNRERRGDTALVTDARGKKFTVNPQKESMTVNPNTGIMEVKPHKQADPMDMEKLMAIVRRQESGKFEGDYTKDAATRQYKKGQRRDTASGAYQYNNKTWKDVLSNELKMSDILKQYPRAVNAPKEIQDMVTQKRFEMWRSQGRSDHEIILKHFTGNFAGKIDAKAQVGNPTPAKYARDIAEHSAEYDKTFKPTMTAQEKPAAVTASAAPASAPKESPGITDRLKSLVSPLIGPSQSVAAPAPEKARKEDPQPTGSVDFAPASMIDKNYLQKQQMTPAAPDNRTMMEKPQNAVSINPLEMRPAHMQPTPSLARAMDNARGVVNPSYTTLTRSRSG